MKHLYTVPLFILMVVACNMSKNNNTPPIYEGLLAQYRETLIGKFDGLHINTLIAEPFGDRAKSIGPNDIYAGEFYNWRVYPKNGTVKELKIEDSTIGIKFVEEGDLDGDGQDEWGFDT